jgi:hypothetical protein
MTREETIAQYEKRRRARILGLAIDQTLTGVKNIIVYSSTTLWAENHPQWLNIKDHAEDILVEMMKLERKLALMVDLYATMVPNNPEVTQSHENSTTNQN